MKCIKPAAAAVAVLIAFCGCGKKYPDYSQYINDIILSQESFFEKLDASDSPEKIVKAVNEFGESLLSLEERGKKLREKYPESASWESLPPDDLKDEWERFQVKWSEFEEKMKLKKSGDAKYRNMLADPRVRDAFRELGSITDNLNFL